MSVEYSIVIPAYNEGTRLVPTLDRVLGFIRQQGWSAEVLVVNDGSRDDTAEVVRSYAERHPAVRLIENPGNRGKGFSVRHGVLKATGDWILISDADFSTPIEEIATLRQKAADGFDLVIGSRALRPELVAVHQAWPRESAGKFFNLIMRTTTGLPFRDTQCGFKLVRREPAQEIFERQKIGGFGFDVEVLYLARKLGYRAAEVPVRWANAPGSKVGMFSGLAAFADLARIRWWDVCGQYDQKS